MKLLKFTLVGIGFIFFSTLLYIKFQENNFKNTNQSVASSSTSGNLYHEARETENDDMKAGRMLFTKGEHNKITFKQTSSHSQNGLSGLGIALALQDAYNKIAEDAVKAVVSIQVVSEAAGYNAQSQNDIMRQFMEEFFGQFNGNQGNQQPSRKVEAFGSGFLINKEGYLLSNYHVVKDAVEIKIFFKDNNKEYTAELVGADPDTDIALLKIKEKRDYPYLKLGDSDKVSIGDIVVAIGNPFRLAQTLTTGVVSATGRTGIIGNKLENFIQTDVAINEGNSGGPLIDLHGNVIGINSAILSRGGGSIGISFSIPINMAKNIVDQLRTKGKVERGWIGISFAPVERNVAEGLGIDYGGVIVNKIIEGSPADNSDLKAGDILVSYEGKKVKNGSDLINKVSSTRLGKRVKLGIVRDGKKKDVYVTIKKKSPKKLSNLSRKPTKISKEYFGLKVSPMSQDQLDYFQVSSSFGVNVSQLKNNSPYRENGGKVGDIILSINHYRVQSIKKFETVMNQLSDKKKFVIKFQRNDSVYYLVFKI